MRSKFETITPAKAQKWLATMEQNRRVKRGNIIALTRAIENDEWVANGETIKFDEDGHLIDGQHRLLAVVEADKPIQSLVVRDLPAISQETVDTGKARTLADTLKLRGETNVLNLAATINMIHRWQRRNIFNRPENNPTRGQAIQFLHDHPELRDMLKDASHVSQKLGQGIPVSVIATCMYAFSKIDEPDTKEFWYAVAEGVYEDGSPIDPSSPIFTLKQYIIRNRTGHKRQPSEQIHAVIVKAWNAYRKGVPVQLLIWRGGGSRPEQFPEAI